MTLKNDLGFVEDSQDLMENEGGLADDGKGAE